jgi:Homeodomain-like domain
MTAIKSHLPAVELEHRYKTASEAIAKSHFHALWLLARGYSIDQVAGLLSFSTRWVRILIKRYNEGGPERLGDQRAHNGTEPKILTPQALAALRERLTSPPGRLKRPSSGASPTPGSSPKVRQTHPQAIRFRSNPNFNGLLEGQYGIELAPRVGAAERSITGHIDFLQVRNGAVHILDYKPDARTNKPIAQLAIYALALPRLVPGIKLFDIKRAWFNEERVLRGISAHAVSENRPRTTTWFRARYRARRRNGEILSR